MPACRAEDFLLASKRCEISNLQQLLMTGELVKSISQLVHTLQRERGLSNVYIASSGQRFGPQRLAQIEQGEHLETELRARLASINLDACHLSGSVRLYTRIAYVVHGLNSLPSIRQKTLSLQISVKELTGLMSRLIAGLLSVVFEAADTATDPDITRALVAMFNFMQGKELAGQERAWGASGFAAGHFELEDQQKLHDLIDSQSRCFEVFTEFSSESPLISWQALQSDPCSDELIRLRQLVARSEEGQAIPSAFSEIWYDVATCRIDAMRAIESLLAADLLELCQTKLKAAEQDLQNHRRLLDDLAKEDDVGSSSLSYLTDSLHAYKQDLSITPGRSVYELLKAQSMRLQLVNDELQQARQALTERKTLERAKGLLMEYQGLSEEAAYRQIRQAAMEQNLRVIDIADTIIKRTQAIIGKK